ncbi:hypothetical protein Barb4_03206 [Bacteroidales bacterium Barb4]|nr:hypothetical protein Barb4_03206 [Bacteroidales bacterium Barb4]
MANDTAAGLVRGSESPLHGVINTDGTFTIKGLPDRLNAKVDTAIMVAGKRLSGNVTLDASSVGLKNVDNTADSVKPISKAVQAALNAKASQTRFDGSANVKRYFRVATVKYDTSSGGKYSEVVDVNGLSFIALKPISLRVLVNTRDPSPVRVEFTNGIMPANLTAYYYLSADSSNINVYLGGQTNYIENVTCTVLSSTNGNPPLTMDYVNAPPANAVIVPIIDRASLSVPFVSLQQQSLPALSKKLLFTVTNTASSSDGYTDAITFDYVFNAKNGSAVAAGKAIITDRIASGESANLLEFTVPKLLNEAIKLRVCTTRPRNNYAQKYWIYLENENNGVIGYTLNVSNIQASMYNNVNPLVEVALSTDTVPSSVKITTADDDDRLRFLSGAGNNVDVYFRANSNINTPFYMNGRMDLYRISSNAGQGASFRLSGFGSVTSPYASFSSVRAARASSQQNDNNYVCWGADSLGNVYLHIKTNGAGNVNADFFGDCSIAMQDWSGRLTKDSLPSSYREYNSPSGANKAALIYQNEAADRFIGKIDALAKGKAYHLFDIVNSNANETGIRDCMGFDMEAFSILSDFAVNPLVGVKGRAELDCRIGTAITNNTLTFTAPTVFSNVTSGLGLKCIVSRTGANAQTYRFYIINNYINSDYPIFWSVSNILAITGNNLNPTVNYVNAIENIPAETGCSAWLTQNTNVKTAIDTAIDTAINTTINAATKATVNTAVTTLLNALYPVGSYYMSDGDDTSDKMVAKFADLGIANTAWEQVRGKTIVGVDAADDDFKTPKKTGGEKYHIHGVSMVFPQNYSIPSLVSEQPTDTGIGIGTTDGDGYVEYSGFVDQQYGSNLGVRDMSATKGVKTQYKSVANGSTAREKTLQPYVTTYIWRRTK